MFLEALNHTFFCHFTKGLNTCFQVFVSVEGNLYYRLLKYLSGASSSLAQVKRHLAVIDSDYPPQNLIILQRTLGYCALPGHLQNYCTHTSVTTYYLSWVWSLVALQPLKWYRISQDLFIRIK